MKSVFEESIRTHPFFHGMKAQHLAMLGKGATEAKFEPGEIIFRENQPANRFLLIQGGNVALEVHEPAGGTILVECLHEGDVLG